MLRIALRNLFQNKIRLVIAVGGVALALMLILALDAVVGGMEAKLTAYIDYSGADIFVAQSGVRNMHMAASALPLSVKSQVRAVPGVASVTPVLYLTNVVVANETRHLAYVIGVPPRAAAGGPWRIVAGKALPGSREAIIDRGIAEQSGIGLGDTVEILGEDFTVAGLSEGTANLTNSVAFIARADFRALARGRRHRKLRAGDGRARPVARRRRAPDRSAGPRCDRADAPGVRRPGAQGDQRYEHRRRHDHEPGRRADRHGRDGADGVHRHTRPAGRVWCPQSARRAQPPALRRRADAGAHQCRASDSCSELALPWRCRRSSRAPASTCSFRCEARRCSKWALRRLSSPASSAILPIMQIAGLDPAMVFRGKTK